MTAARRRPRVISEDGESVDLARVQVEALANLDGPIVVELVVGTSVRVLPPRMWRISAVSAIRQGDFEAWAKGAMASTEDYETFMDVDPTLEDVEGFMKRLTEASGEGNSPSSSLSSRRSKPSRRK